MKFIPISVSSKFGLCGLPIRVDTYKGCEHQCIYCFSNHRKIMEFSKKFQLGGIDVIKRTLDRIFNQGKVSGDNFLDMLIKDNITWHCGGMSDPFQPKEETYKLTQELVRVTRDYNISILFSTKGFSIYGVEINPKIHTFQISISNLDDRKDIEKNVASIDKRIKLFKELKLMGCRVGIRVQPFIPGITSSDIVEVFKSADYFTIEGLKIVPQNEKHKNEILSKTKIPRNYFTQMGLLNIKPEIRERYYSEFLEELEKNNIPYSLADNDMHHISSGKCCCGDNLINKSTNFNTTAMAYKYGLEWDRTELSKEIGEYKECICDFLFYSQRREGLKRENLKTVSEYLSARYGKKSSPFSPKFLYANKVQKEKLF